MLCYLAVRLLMKKIIIPYFIIIIICSSCKTLQQLTAKDHSETTAKTQPAQNSNVTFLDNIEVTPGYKSGTAVPSHAEDNKTVNTQNVEKNPNSFTANQLQIKYAPILNASYSQLTNMALLQDIDHWWGTSYCMGGSTEKCIDCSSFSQKIIADVYGIKIPRTAQEQFNASERIDVTDLQEGDLVFFRTTTKGISHVGVYLLNNKFVHASTSNGVTISDLSDPYWWPRFRGAGRVK